MVLGLKGRSRKGSLVQLDYLIHVHEINPWPQQLLKSAKSVLLQWENGDQSSGYFTSDIRDEKIVFKESFKLPVNLRREASKKRTSNDGFQKNFLEFYVYEQRKEKTTKGQLLGSAVINLADYRIITETVSIKTPINFKKSSKSLSQSVLCVSIQPFDLQKDGSSLGKDGSGSVSELLEEEDDAEAEIASFTDDDDVSSHSSQTLSSSALESRASLSQSKKIGPVAGKAMMANSGKHIPVSGEAPTNPVVTPDVESFKLLSGSLSPLPLGDSSYAQENAYQSTKSSTMATRVGVNSNLANYPNHPTIDENDSKAWTERKLSQEKVDIGNLNCGGKEDKQQMIQPDIGCQDQPLDVRKHSHTSKDEVDIRSTQASHKHLTYRSDTLKHNRKENGQSRAIANNKLRHVMSVQYPSNLTKGDGPSGNSYLADKIKGTNSTNDDPNIFLSNATSQEEHDLVPENKVGRVSKVEMFRERHPVNTVDKAPNCVTPVSSEIKQIHNFSSEKDVELESDSEPNVELMSTIEMLIEELREAAAVEAGLYSVVAEHGSSINKVHAPARRLSRFFSYACKTNPSLKRASAAKTAVSGLVLVSKTCGNDVARLTFWLSNSIVLRTLVSRDISKTKNGGRSTLAERFPQKMQESSVEENYKDNIVESSADWDDPQSFIFALEKVEAWIFYRIVESVWWQSMTPHMQSAAAKSSSSRKSHGRKYGLGDQDQGNFSIDLWKKAFKDACERLCPIRAGGHECGCLSVLPRLVMEQLVDRLDVAMFNAVLRESAEEMPTDPVSDPISDPKVLPIPAGKSSFGAGAQLKNAIGNWSRWLTDTFGIDDTDGADENSELDDHKRHGYEKPSRLFHLLNALSDLMMLPFEMLADKATRKEVCPTFGALLVRRVLNNFVPDEFCPNQIPEAVYEALGSEDGENVEGTLTDFPCKASPTTYSPPPAASILAALGEVGSQTLLKTGSSVLKKSYTSDDELDELESPLASIVIDNSRISPTATLPSWMLTGRGGRKSIRYQLLREVWRGVK